MTARKNSEAGTDRHDERLEYEREIEASMKWIQEHGGMETVAEKIRALCGDNREGLEKAFNAVGVPFLARILVGRYV